MSLVLVKNFSSKVYLSVIDISKNPTIKKIKEIAPIAISFFGIVASYKVKSFGDLTYSITPVFVFSAIQNILYFLLNKSEKSNQEDILFFLVIFKSCFFVSSCFYLGSFLFTFKITSLLATIGYSYLFLDRLENISYDEDVEFNPDIKSSDDVCHKGFTNVGNTCFINSVLKCFLHNKNLSTLLDQELNYSNDDKKELIDLLKKLKQDYFSKDTKDKEITETLIKIRNSDLVKSKFVDTTYESIIVKETATEFDNYEFRNRLVFRVGIKFPKNYLNDILQIEDKEKKDNLQKIHAMSLDSNRDRGLLLSGIENILKCENGLGQGNPKKLLAEYLGIGVDCINIFYIKQTNKQRSYTQEDAHEMFMILSELLKLEEKNFSSIGIEEVNKSISYISIINLENSEGNIEAKKIFENWSKDKKIFVKNVKELKLICSLFPRFNLQNQKSKSKITNLMDPIILNVHDELTDKDVEIKLIMESCVYHIGNTKNSGHYISIIKQDEKLFYHNDETVREISSVKDCEENIYLAMYSVELIN